MSSVPNSLAETPESDWPELATPLRIEACSPDGLVEAYRLDGHDFAIGVQWHPEVSAASDVMSRTLFEAFGASCRRYAAKPPVRGLARG